MNWIFYLLIVVEVLVGLMLIGVILLQRSKDQGLGLAFGAGMGESLFGSQAVNVLVRITVILAAVFFLNTMVLARLVTISRSRPQTLALPKIPPAATAMPAAAPAGTPAPSEIPAGGYVLPPATEPAAPAVVPTPDAGTAPAPSASGQ